MVNPVTKAKYSVSVKGIFSIRVTASSAGHHQSDQRQNNGSDMPDSMKEIIGETG